MHSTRSLDESDRFIRFRELRRLTGLSRTTIWRLVRRGEFPSARRISAGAVGWLLSEVAGWRSRCPVTASPETPPAVIGTTAPDASPTAPEVPDGDAAV